MNEWPNTPKPEAEEAPENLAIFQSILTEALSEDVSFENTEGTYEVDTDSLSLSFVLSYDLFEIRNIDTKGNSGIGSKVIEAIHEFADNEDLEVKASNVRTEARGFWEKMGYEIGKNTEEYFRR